MLKLKCVDPSKILPKLSSLKTICGTAAAAAVRRDSSTWHCSRDHVWPTFFALPPLFTSGLTRAPHPEQRLLSLFMPSPFDSATGCILKFVSVLRLPRISFVVSNSAVCLLYSWYCIIRFLGKITKIHVLSSSRMRRVTCPLISSSPVRFIKKETFISKRYVPYIDIFLNYSNCYSFERYPLLSPEPQPYKPRSYQTPIDSSQLFFCCWCLLTPSLWAWLKGEFSAASTIDLQTPKTRGH